ncbi:MAG: Bax inhibitor-1/YccA family protein [Oscillospiraceae bacterium]|nr:Bax inhibitor-1/YccA family protein [Oscillospiraceae bacterium]
MFYNENQTGLQVSELFPSIWATEEELDRAATSCLSRVFLRMFAALLVTAAAAYAVVASVFLQQLIFSNTYVFYGLMIAELVLVIAVAAGMNRLSVAAANILFFAYAAINGLTLSVIFFVYDIGIIYQAFAVSALMFAGMSLYGVVTRRNLSSIGSICMMGLFGIIVASLANFFFRSDMLDSIICYVGVLIFVGLTAYDTQRIRWMLREANADDHEEAIKKISVAGALTLYLDFINIFLKILRIMGKRR